MIGPMLFSLMKATLKFFIERIESLVVDSVMIELDLNDDKSELTKDGGIVYVSHRSIKHLHDTNRCILKIKNRFSSMQYRESIILGTPILICKRRFLRGRTPNSCRHINSSKYDVNNFRVKSLCFLNFLFADTKVLTYRTSFCFLNK